MKKITRRVMGMTAVICVSDKKVLKKDLENVFSYFKTIDRQFSTYKKTSETEKMNAHTLSPKNYSPLMKKILKLGERTKKETNGYFDMFHKGKFDPSGIVKGYAIFEASRILKRKGYKNYLVGIGGDIDARGKNEKGEKWKVGIQNPFNVSEIVKVLHITHGGVATSGNYIRGEHIYNPKTGGKAKSIAGVTVIAKNIYEADRMATAVFAMGEEGITFLENLKGFEGYMIKQDKTAVMTTGFDQYLN